jgi:hypothetical protein
MAITTSLLPRAIGQHTAAIQDATTWDSRDLESRAFRIVEARQFKRVLSAEQANVALSDACQRDSATYDSMAREIAAEMERRINGGGIKLVDIRSRQDGTTYNVRSDFLASYIKLVDELARR